LFEPKNLPLKFGEVALHGSPDNFQVDRKISVRHRS
jgi:hypothetical protein